MYLRLRRKLITYSIPKTQIHYTLLAFLLPAFWSPVILTHQIVGVSIYLSVEIVYSSMKAPQLNFLTAIKFESPKGSVHLSEILEPAYSYLVESFLLMII